MSVNLRNLEYSPLVNPLMEPQEIKVQRRYVRTRSSQDLLDPKTGVISGVAAIHTVEERDDAEFVKVFADGVKAAFGLTLTGSRVFQAVLDVYQKTTMKGGYAEAVELFWFGKGINGRELDMSEKTFQRGLKELLAKKLSLSAKSVQLLGKPSAVLQGRPGCLRKGICAQTFR